MSESMMPARIITETTPQVWYCHGAWTFNQINGVLESLSHLSVQPNEALILDGSHIQMLDSAGAWALCQLKQRFIQQNTQLAWQGFSTEQQTLLGLVSDQLTQITAVPVRSKPSGWLERIGRNTIFRYLLSIQFISFLGEIVVALGQMLRQPRSIQWRAFLHVIHETGFEALGIVAMLCFLIGIVLAYQASQQLLAYGANVYIVPLLGIGILQEFGPLITAIIIAGRTSSAFTAQIGSMKVNEEIDALRTLGLSPVHRLVLPKVFGLLLTMPLLVVWADIFGLLGGILVSNHMLNIGFYGFIAQLPKVVLVTTFLNGLIKAPVFAFIIASVGCFYGFQVESTADSVGRQTTKSVVKAIFMIIIADAIFSIIQPWQSF